MVVQVTCNHLKRGAPENMKQHGFMTYLPTVQFGPGMTSATEIRAKWAGMSDEEKMDLVNNLYPMSSAPVASKAIEIFNNVLAEEKEVIAMPMGSIQKPEKEKLHPIAQYVRDKEERLKNKEVELDEDKKYHYYNLDRGVYRLQKDNNGRIIGKMHDRQKEMGAGFPNADEVLSNTKQAAAKVAKLNEKVEETRIINKGDTVDIIPAGGMGAYGEEGIKRTPC